MEIMSRLKFLQNLRAGDKIDTACILRQPNSWITPFARYLRGETKIKTLAFVTQTIEDAFTLQKKYALSNENYLTEMADVILKDLHKALVGVANLKRTYSHDLKFVCDLTSVCEHTHLRLVAISPKFSQTNLNTAKKESKKNEQQKEHGRKK
jgi:hypothetical protein